jgi:predicted nucleic-acid-binding Zn-ribbon protein
MTDIEDQLAKAFVCGRCGSTGANVRTVSMQGEKTSRFLQPPTYRFAVASCLNCGASDVYDATLLELKPNLGPFLWFLYSGEEAENRTDNAGEVGAEPGQAQ